MEKKLRIGVNTFALSSQRTGAGIYISRLIEHLSYIDKENIYSIFINKNNSNHFLKIEESNFRKIDCGGSTCFRPLRILWEQFKLPGYLANIDILHSPAFVAPLKLKCKSIITVFDMTFFLFPDKHSKVKCLYFTSLMPQSVRRADKIITLSESSKRDIVNYFRINPDKVEVIYLAAGEAFHPVGEALVLEGIKTKYHIGADFILFTGVLEPRKNLDRLIKAYSHLKKENKIKEKLVIVGQKGWGYRSLFELVKELGLEQEVIFTGYVPEDDLVLLYNSAKIFIYPSLYEGFGLPVIEAMSCGVPVITSWNSSLREIAGNAAVLIDSCSEKEIADSCYELLQSDALRENLRLAGLKRSAEFSWKDTALQTLEVYKNIG